MCKICPKCGRIAEYDSYYSRVSCTSCGWQSEKMSEKCSKNYNKFLFGDIVVVDGDQIGVVVKTWSRGDDDTYYCEVYVRSYNEIKEYNETDIELYRVRRKYSTNHDIELWL